MAITPSGERRAVRTTGLIEDSGRSVTAVVRALGLGWDQKIHDELRRIANGVLSREFAVLLATELKVEFAQVTEAMAVDAGLVLTDMSAAQHALVENLHGYPEAVHQAALASTKEWLAALGTMEARNPRQTHRPHGRS